jgi:hypothetical protein
MANMACVATRHITTQDFEDHMHVSMHFGNVSLEGKTDADIRQSDSKLMITHRRRKPAKENGESKKIGRAMIIAKETVQGKKFGNFA